MIKKALLFILISVVEVINAQDAILKGLVTDGQTKEPLIGALVMVAGTDLVVESDLEGNYYIAVPPGIHQIVFSYDTYHSDTLKSQVFTAGQILYKNIGLEPSITQMETVVLIQKTDKSSAEEVLKTRKEATTTSDGVDQKTLTKSNNTSTADGLRRVTGASIQEGRFAIIRGMGDRYNAGYINGAPLPSTESDRKAFSFDVIPTALVDNLVILKSGSPDLAGDFGGGVIKVATKDIPDTLAINVSGGVQANSITTFRSYKTFEGGSLDFLGFDDGKRERPELSTTLSNANPGKDLKLQYIEDTKKFNNNYELVNKSVPLGSRFNFSIGFPVLKREKVKLGAFLGYNYIQTFTIAPRVNRFYTLDQNIKNSDYNDTIGTRSVNNAGVLNLNASLGSKVKVAFKNLASVNSSFQSLNRYGLSNGEADIYSRVYANMMQYNRLYSSQLALDYKVSSRLRLDVLLSNSSIAKKVPDYRVTTYSSFVTDGEEYTAIATGENFNAGNGRFFSDLKEQLKSAAVNGTYKFNEDLDSSAVVTTLKTGAFLQTRDRSFESFKYIYKSVKQDGLNPSRPQDDFSSESITKNNTYLYDPTTLPDRNYNASSNLNAAYIMLDQKIAGKLRLTYGARYEMFDQQVNSADVKAEIKKNTWLPSLNANYQLTPNKSNLRLAVYKSLNRPEFREVSKFAFYDFFLNSDVVGNPKLKQAELYNFEARYEYLPTANQMFSVGGFYKRIDNPIEQRLDPDQPTFRTYNYANEKRANVLGLEVEYKKTFDFIAKLTNAKVFDFIYLASNLSLIQSELETSEGSTSNNNRTLQGQSPYLINIMLGYDNSNNGWSATLSANKYGRRLAFVGASRNSSGQKIDYGFDIYENPRTVVDLQVSKTIKRITIRGTFGDLLHQDLVFYNDINANKKYETNGDNLIFKTKMGYTFTGSLSARF